MGMDTVRKICNSLIITEVEQIQNMSNDMLKNLVGEFDAGAYVCLNRPQHTVKKLLMGKEVDVSKIFFIDCISSSLIDVKNEENVMHIANPADLTGLSIAISEFLSRVPGKKFIFLDALGTLLIYNHEDIVIKFVRSTLEEASQRGICAVMLTPKTEDNVLIKKIMPFFDNIVKDE